MLEARLEQLAQLEGSAKVVPASLDLLDLPALARQGTGLAGKYIARLREVDAICAVLRAFDDPSVPSDESGLDPVSQAQEIMLELAIADHDIMDRRRGRLVKEAAAEPIKRAEAAAVAEATELLGGGTALRRADWSDEQLKFLRDSDPLTLKPTIWVVNSGEEAVGHQDLAASLREIVPSADSVMILSAKIEEEATRLEPEDRTELLAGLGMGEGALAAVVRAAYQALDLISFYTVGPKESHAWSVRAGSTAPAAAGKIHTDMERGFIRAEVASIDEVIAAGGWDQAKKSGRVRVEGKAYVVAQDDVLLVRFSV